MLSYEVEIATVENFFARGNLSDLGFKPRLKSLKEGC
jgi:hypothetical protein